MAASITSAMRTQVSQLYVSLFGRAPDGTGLGFWAGALAGGKSIATVAQEMYDSAPARDYYPSFLTNQEIVEKFYVNVLGRTADADGLAFWLKAMNATGATKGAVIASMIDAVVGYTGTDAAGVASKSLFVNKATVAEFYGLQNLASGSSTVLAGVTSSADSVDAAKASILSPAVSGASYTLGTGIDTLTGTSGADSFDASLTSSSAQTLQTSDVINGGAGNDTLTAVVTGASLRSTLTSVENVTLTTSAATFTFDMSNATDVQNVGTLSSTNDVVLNNTRIKTIQIEDMSTSAKTTTVNYADAALTGSADSLAINLSSVVDLTTDHALVVTKAGTTTGANLESIVISSEGLPNFISSLNSDGVNATSVTITGSANLTIGTALNSEVTTINAAGETGALTITLSTGNTTYTGGSGIDTVTIDVAKDTINLGAGNDVAIMNGNSLTNVDVLQGGDGTDTLNLTAAGANANLTGVTGIERLTLGYALAANVTLDRDFENSDFTTVNMGDTSSAKLIFGANILSAYTVELTAGLTNIDMSGANNDASFTVKANDAIFTSNDVIVGGAGNDTDVLRITSAGGSADLTYVSAFEQITVAASSSNSNLSTVIVTADATIAASKTLVVDASALVGGTAALTLNLGDETNANATVNILGGAGADVLLLGDSNDTINAGAGNDSINFTLGSLTNGDVVNGGDGSDTLFLQSATVNDSAFVGVTGVEKLLIPTNITSVVTLGANFDASAIGTLNIANFDTGGALVIGSAVDNALTVVLATGDATVNAVNMNASGSLNVTGNDALFTSGDVINAGNGTSDSLTITVAGGTANVASVTGFENIIVKNNSAIANANDAVTIVTGDSTVAASKTLVVDASALVNTVSYITLNTGDETNTNATINVIGSSGNDVLLLGDSNDTINTGAGNDTINFSTGSLTNGDTISGGAGKDTVVLNFGTAIADAAFKNITEVEVLTAAADMNTNVTLNGNFAATGITTINVGNTNSAKFILSASETTSLQINVTGAGTTNVDGSNINSSASLTVYTSNDAFLNGADTISAGTGTSDKINVTAFGGNANIGGLSGFEYVNVIRSSTAANVNDATTVTLTDSVIGASKTLTVDASALVGGLSQAVTLNANAETNLDSTLVFIGGAGNDAVILGHGILNLNGGAGNDTFTSLNDTYLISGDAIEGGAGTDTLVVKGNVAMGDEVFTSMNGLEVLATTTSGNVTANITLGTEAADADIAKFNVSAGTNFASSKLILAAGFTSTLTINDGGSTANMNVDVSAFTNTATFSFNEADLTVGDIITGGTNATEIVNITAGSGSANAEGFINVGQINVTGSAETVILMSADTILGANKSMTVDATALTGSSNLTFNANGETTSNATLTIYGSNGADSIYGGNGAVDTIYGYSGADLIYGNAGNDTINGGNDVDSIYGGNGADTLYGGTGNDIFFVKVEANKFTFDTIMDAANGDVINLTTNLNSAAAADLTVTKINASGVASFSDLLDLAAAGDATGATGKVYVSYFEYGGDTYIVSDMTSTALFNAASDIVVKLSGTYSSLSLDADVINGGTDNGTDSMTITLSGI